MMRHAAIEFSTIRADDILMVHLLGMCSLMGAFGRADAAPGIVLAARVVFTLSTVSSHLLDTWLFIPAGSQSFRNLSTGVRARGDAADVPFPFRG